MKPVIAITTDRRAAAPTHDSAGRVRPAQPEVFVAEAVVRVTRALGLEALLVPPGGGVGWLGRVDGLVITGGAFDIHPRHYGRGVRGRLDRVDEDRTALELALARACLERGVPVLGVCGGMQVLAVAAGGTLIQDLPTEPLQHEQPTDPARPWHPVRLTGGALGEGALQVNSTHHQAVEDPGTFSVIGRAPDGVIEAIELGGHPFALGVQWHPERLGPEGWGPYRALARATKG